MGIFEYNLTLSIFILILSHRNITSIVGGEQCTKLLDLYLINYAIIGLTKFYSTFVLFLPGGPFL